MKRTIFKVLYIAMILLGLFGIYTFVFVSHVSILKKAILIIITVGVILSGISGLLNIEKKHKNGREENDNSNH